MSDGARTVILEPATQSDLFRIVDWDEQAARASTGWGFTDDARTRRMRFYEEAIKSDRFDVLLIRVGNQHAPCGSALVDYAHKSATIRKVIGQPFVECGVPDCGPALTADDIVKVIGTPGDGTTRAHLMSIALDAHVRGKGIGTMAIDALMRHCAARGVEVLTFSTGLENAPMRRLIKGVTYLEVRTDARDGYADTKLVGVIRLKPKAG